MHSNLHKALILLKQVQACIKQDPVSMEKVQAPIK